MDTRIGFGYDSHEIQARCTPAYLGGMTLNHHEWPGRPLRWRRAAPRHYRRTAGRRCRGRYWQLFPRPAIRAGKTLTPPSFSTWRSKSCSMPATASSTVRYNAGSGSLMPKISPIAAEMCSRVADLLGVSIDQVSIKAKTPEGLNLDHVAQCHAAGSFVERVSGAGRELKSDERSGGEPAPA